MYLNYKIEIGQKIILHRDNQRITISTITTFRSI